MSARHSCHDATGVISTTDNGLITAAFGTTVPTDGTAGYAVGAIFHHTDGAAGTALYQNEGTATSCDFNPIITPGVDLSTLAATAAEINRAADVSTRIVNCTASTLVITEAEHDGKLIVLDRAAGIAVTLCAAAAGISLEFLVKTTFTGAASIKSATGADIIIGHAIMGNNSDNTVVNWQAVAGSTLDTIDLFGTANSTGGMAGQRVRLTGLAANLWYAEIIGDAAGTEASPFADTVT